MVDPYWTEIDDPTLKTWNALHERVQKLRGDAADSRWIFRGLSSFSHNLISSLDRAICDTRKGTRCEIGPHERWRYEAVTLYDFKRRAHYYLGRSETPDRRDFLEWFSLMRHFGAPARLLDFSYSFPVAAYFAINNATEDAGVFCIDYNWLVNKVEGSGGLVKPKKSFQNRKVFWKFAIQTTPPPRPFVVPVRPFLSNERIHVQQGLFLCPTDVSLEFAANFERVDERTELKKHVFKLKIIRDSHPEIMLRLREMNISCETLYPGLEGFTRSLRDLFYLPSWHPPERRLRGAISEDPLF